MRCDDIVEQLASHPKESNLTNTEMKKTSALLLSHPKNIDSHKCPALLLSYQSSLKKSGLNSLLAL